MRRVFPSDTSQQRAGVQPSPGTSMQPSQGTSMQPSQGNSMQPSPGTSTSIALCLSTLSGSRLYLPICPPPLHSPIPPSPPSPPLPFHLRQEVVEMGEVVGGVEWTYSKREGELCT
ncbi:unnamed protein product [Closterium sp. NIES-53]